MFWLRRSLRVVGIAVASWVGLFVAVNLTILLVGVAARLAGKDPQLRSDDWPGITHLRMVDDKLLVGGQTSLPEYRDLQENHRVTTVVDVRPTVDRHRTTERDDPEALEEIGLRYVPLPIPDGRAPTPDQIRRFLEIVDDADGRVYAHCGGGVGRSTSLAAAYEASRDQDPSVLEQLAVGPPTVEQIWYVATLEPGEPEHAISPVVAVLSRVIDSPRTAYGWVLDQL